MIRKVVVAALIGATSLTICANGRWSTALAEQSSPAGANQEGARSVSEADYARAAEFMPFNLMGKVKNPKVTPHWIDDGASFWYRRDGENGPGYVVVETETGQKRPAFDYDRLVQGLREAGAEETSADELVVEKIDFSDSRTTVIVSANNRKYECVTGEFTCSEGEEEPLRNPAYLYSPDGARAAFVRDHNIWIVDIETGRERALTSDGVSDYAYGNQSDFNYFEIPQRRAEAPRPPAGSLWSPDGKYLMATRLDERGVEPYPFIDSAPASGTGRPDVFLFRVALPGEEHQVIQERFFIEVDTGRTIPLSVGEQAGGGLAVVSPSWSDDGRYMYYLGANGYAQAWVRRMDMQTGEIHNVYEESNDTFFMFNNSLYSLPNSVLVTLSDEFVWFSERSGWGHLYLYDLTTGELKNRITSGDWLVRDVVKVDEENRVIYFTGLGREEGRNPYYRHLYRVNFDGTGTTLLTPEDAAHEIGHSDGSVSPDGAYFVDTYSRVDQPPVSVLRDSNGDLIAELERADASALFDMGWTAPEEVIVKAADGETDLVALVYKPSNFDPTRTYPVIEHLYGGPQMTITPRTFMNTVMSRLYVQAQKELGYIMVVTDVRGTTERSKTFNDILYDNYEDYMIDDHVAVIEELARTRPYMDLDRVGVEGHSFGGFGSARAILKRSDFYKVAVSSAGSHNYQGMYTIPFWFSRPVYSDGSRLNPTGAETPSNWKGADNGTWAKNLEGKLLLAYGELDENAYPATTLQLARRLQEANKSYDLLYLPGADHDFARKNMYFIRRKWDYFVEHLMAAEPPQNYLLTAPPPEKWRHKLQ